ncbi:MAG: UDP-N-acetylmuramoyl-L-alanine--D-glutamate ligase [Chloroflexi bacterium]|jgi:UDP-N-acetylmuramoylalanine--D-glutamate ligase|nr:UDP-N-acetylmuramoyl-L-alanine--D-glutamate ligase [Chloroflexota bacterium]
MRQWEGMQVVMIGAARQGLALSRYLVGKGARVILNDRRTDDVLKDVHKSLVSDNITWVTGGHPLEILSGVDLVCVSGGVPLNLPLILEAVRRNIPLSNDSQIFLEEAPCPVIGITGSSGKTTTTTLVGAIAERHYSLRKPGRKAWVGGNIGHPLIQDLDEMHSEDIAIMELSSFQLEIMTRSPQIAAVLNLTPNHLDRHGTMAEYISAKAHILTHQSPQNLTVLNRDDPNIRNLYPEVRGRQITFGINPPHDNQDATYVKRGNLYLQADGQHAKIIRSEQINLLGPHNLANVLAAIAISAGASFSLQAIYEGIIGFTGVPHRLEFVREWNGAAWYNDSIATSPDRTIAALQSFNQPIILLAGGRDKNLPWQDLAGWIHQKVDHLILFGEAATLIQNTLEETLPGVQSFTLDLCQRLKDAVKIAAGYASPGDVVLLSPGGTSYDEFIDFEERGKRFVQCVTELL